MKIGNIIIWVIFILAIFVFIWYLLGNSPTFEQAILIFIAGISITTLVKVNVLKTKVNILEKSFMHLAKDFKQHIRHK